MNSIIIGLTGLDLLALPIHVIIVASIILFLVALFIGLYLVPGVLFWFKLNSLRTNLLHIKASQEWGKMEKVFEADKTLSHLWSEYAQSLHEQKDFNAKTGQFEIVAMRSTVPAEMYFNNHVVIDSRLRTEFFKHLPGIFTGVGIIGTFLGLIKGLRAFQISDDTNVVRQSLELLLHGVFEAFIVSATAIALAMVVTFLEKLLITALYKKNEKLSFVLDSMFESGAGEEYMARLVKASEDSADQSKILKDALVKELEVVLSKLTEQQIHANTQSQQTLGHQIVESLVTGLKQPLDQIAEAVQVGTKDQGQAVNQMLTDVLAGFSQRLQELFGGQITGINQLQQQTIEALQGTVARLNQMASSVETAGQKTTDAMAEKLTDVLMTMDARQNIMNQRMTEFVEQLRSLVSESQTETNQKLQATLSGIGETVKSLVESLRTEATQASSAHREREQEASEKMGEALRTLNSNVESLVGTLGSKVDSVVGTLQDKSQAAEAAQVEREARMQLHAESSIERLTKVVEYLMAEVRKVTDGMRSSVDAMRNTTSDAISRLNTGAETLYVAASDFSKAGESVSGVLNQSTAITEKLAQAAGAVNSSTLSLQGIVADYGRTRDLMGTMLSDLTGVVENAKREASLTENILSRIESASQKLLSAQLQADEYLQGISEALAGSHEEFTEALRTSLDSGYSEFYGRLTSATGLLRTAIEELALAVENPVPSRS